jgi:hypothetical protein
VFSAGLSSAIDTGEGNNIGELGNIGNFGNISEKNAAGIYVCSALWILYIAIGTYALILDRRSQNQALIDHQRKTIHETTSSTLQTSGLFLRQLQAKAAKGAGRPQGDTIQVEMSSAEADVSVTSRTVTETQVGAVEIKEKSELKKPKKRPNLKEMILDEHMIIGILMKYNDSFPRFNRLTMFVVMIMGELFLSGLFYQNGQGGTEFSTDVSTKALVDAAKNYSWRDFWIAVYSSVLIIPVGFMLAYLLSRKKIEDLAVSFSLKERFMKVQRVKKYVGYGVSWVLMGFFSYAIVMFSLAFDVIARQWSIADLWMLTFGIATLQDLVIWTNVKLLMKILILYILYKCY